MVEYLALQCAGCRMFQVQQEKKSKKWKCVVCGAAQTLQRVYGRGPASALRGQVQELNMRKGDEPPPEPTGSGVSGLDIDKGEHPEGGWAQFLDEPEAVQVIGTGEEEEIPLATPKKMPASRRVCRGSAASSGPASNSSASLTSSFGSSGSRRASARGVSGRKRGFEDELAEAAAQSSTTQWKRMRATPSTPYHSPRATRSADPFSGNALELGDASYGAEDSSMRYPSWRVGGARAPQQQQQQQQQAPRPLFDPASVQSVQTHLEDMAVGVPPAPQPASIWDDFLDD